jgi:hypothetical protein
MGRVNQNQNHYHVHVHVHQQRKFVSLETDNGTALQMADHKLKRNNQVVILSRPRKIPFIIKAV